MRTGSALVESGVLVAAATAAAAVRLCMLNTDGLGTDWVETEDIDWDEGVDEEELMLLLGLALADAGG